MTIVKITKLEHAKDLELPKYATNHSAGLDLQAGIEDKMIIEPGQWKMIPTGIAIELPHGFEAQIRPRSGLAVKYGVTVLNSPGTIDADYRGEICVVLINHSKDNFEIIKGMRIAQMVITKYENVNLEEVKILNETQRGNGGFGSTGD